MNAYLISASGLSFQDYLDLIDSMDWTGRTYMNVDFSSGKVFTDATTIDSRAIPVAVEQIPRPPLSKINFLSLMTDAEIATILTVAKTNVMVEVFVKKLDAATEIHLDDARTVAAIRSLDAAGLLAVGRADQILGGNN